MEIRRFDVNDAKEVVNILTRNYLEVNSKNYPAHLMNELSKKHDEKYVKKIAKYSHVYVVVENDKIIATGGVGNYQENKDIALLINIYVLPEYQRKGYGTLIMETLMNDEIYLNAKLIRVNSSITALEFYKKFGFHFKDNLYHINKDLLYELEKEN